MCFVWNIFHHTCRLPLDSNRICEYYHTCLNIGLLIGYIPSKNTLTTHGICHTLWFIWMVIIRVAISYPFPSVLPLPLATAPSSHPSTTMLVKTTRTIASATATKTWKKTTRTTTTRKTDKRTITVTTKRKKTTTTKNMDDDNPEEDDEDKNTENMTTKVIKVVFFASVFSSLSVHVSSSSPFHFNFI